MLWFLQIWFFIIEFKIIIILCTQEYVYVSVCMCVMCMFTHQCTCIYAGILWCMCVCVCAWVHACIGQQTTLSFILRKASHLLWIVSHWPCVHKWDQTDLSVSCSNLPVSTSLSIGAKSIPPQQAFSHELWGTELRFWCLQAKHFTKLSTQFNFLLLIYLFIITFSCWWAVMWGLINPWSLAMTSQQRGRAAW